MSHHNICTDVVMSASSTKAVAHRCLELFYWHVLELRAWRSFAGVEGSRVGVWTLRAQMSNLALGSSGCSMQGLNPKPQTGLGFRI